MGGTFDVFHKGHEVLIQMALEVSDQVLIGLTTDERADKGLSLIHISEPTRPY